MKGNFFKNDSLNLILQIYREQKATLCNIYRWQRWSFLQKGKPHACLFALRAQTAPHLNRRSKCSEIIKKIILCLTVIEFNLL